MKITALGDRLQKKTRVSCIFLQITWNMPQPGRMEMQTTSPSLFLRERVPEGRLVIDGTRNLHVMDEAIFLPYHGVCQRRVFSEPLRRNSVTP